MTAHDQLFASGTLAGGESATPLPNWIGSIGLRLAAWAKNCADYWEAAATYEQLAALSDAELTQRGLLSRATLAQDVRATCDRNGDA
jgi:hypothetical protein